MRLAKGNADPGPEPEQEWVEAEQFRLLVESVEDYAIFMLDPDGRIVTWNRGARRLEGYTAEEVLGQRFSIVYTEEDRRRGLPEEELRVAAERGRYAVEGWRVRKDGSRFRAHVTITALRDEAGRLVGFAMVTRDLTGREATEEERERLLERERQLRIEAERRAREERALREVARELTAAIELSDVLRRIADGAVYVAKADGAYVERVHSDVNEVEVVAGSGWGWPPLGTRHPYRGSLAEAVIEKGEPEVVPDLIAGERSVSRHLEESCGRCAGVVVPLIAGEAALGALVLLRRPGRPAVTPDEIGRILALSDMAALALRRALVVAESERRLRYLEETERRFHLLVESVLDYAIFMLNPEGRVVSWNRGAQRLKGYTADEILGQHFSVFYTEEDRQRGHPEWELRIAAEQGRYEEEGWRVRKDGSRFPAHVTITAVRDDEGRLLGFAKVTRDITEREREEELRESERRFREIAETIREVFWTVDPEFTRFLYVSPAYEEIWGRPADELYREPRSFLEAVHPQDRERVLAGMEEMRRGEETSMEYRIVRPDGEVRWLWVRGFPVRGGRGEIDRIVGISEDITDRKEREEALRFLAEASHLLASSLEYQQTLRQVANLAVPRVADWCSIDVLEGGRIVRLAVAHVDPAKVALAREVGRRYPPDPNAPVGVARVLRAGEPELVTEIPETLLREAARDEEHFRILRELGMSSAMIVPMVARGRVLGAISFVAAESGRRYDEEDLAFAQELADRAAIAIDNARLYEEAEAARERVTTILESITDAFFAVDRGWRVTYLNRRAEKVFEALGKTREELIGRNLWEAVPEALETTLYEEYTRAMAEQEAAHFEAFVPPLDIWVEVHAYPSPDGLSIYFRDVTERKRAEEGLRLLAEAGEALAASLDYRRTLAGVARLAVPELADLCIVDVLEDGKVERLEVAVADPSKEDLAREYLRFPPDPDDPRNPVARVLRTGKPELIPEVTREFLEEAAPGPDLVRLGLELGLRSIMVVPLIARGHTLGAIAFIAAESERRYAPDDLALAEELARRAAIAIDNARLFAQAQEARGEAERRAREEEALRRAAAAVGAAFTIEEMVHRIAHSALAATDADGAVVERIDIERNEVEVVAVAGERTLPLGARVRYPGSLAELVIERGQPELISPLTGAVRGISADLVEACAMCSALALPLIDAEEAIGALILLREPEKLSFRPDEVERGTTFADLAALAFRKVHLLEESERRREELLQVIESRSRLMRGFSHDVKNPLGAADGFLQLLEQGIMGALAPKQVESVGRARRAIRDALRLIDDLLELARAEAGEIKVERHPVDVREAAREMAEEYRAAAKAKGLIMRVQLPDQLPVIQSDAGRIRQILGNLLSNAVKYTPEGGITVCVEPREDGKAPRPGRWIAVDVIDTGPGVPEEKQHLLFQEFKRIEPDTERGAGLGLAISKRIAQALGGDITVESEVGAGATFTLWLPVA